MWTSAVADSGWKLLGILGPVDIGVALMLLAAFAVGFWTGLIWQIVCLVSVVACLWVSVTYHPVVADFFGADGGGATSSIISGIGVFLCALLVCYLITFLFRGLINAIRPQLPDRIIGSVFGLFVGALVVGVCSFFVLNYGNEETTMRRYVAESKGATAMAAVVRAFVYVLPEDLREKGGPISDFGLVSQEPADGPANVTEAS